MILIDEDIDKKQYVGRNMHDMEIFLERRKKEYQQCENDAYRDAQYAREFLSYEPDREDVSSGLDRAVRQQDVNHALVEFIDELFDEFF